jgi:hypothetical protein
MTSSGACGYMHNVKEKVQHHLSAAETQGTLAPNTERRPQVTCWNMQCAKEDFPRYSRTTAHHGKLQLAFEYFPVRERIHTELGEAAGRFLLAFHFPVRIRVVLLSVLKTLQYIEISEQMGKI